MAKSLAVKRLERILADEDYGSKLARMNRSDERYILDLIDQNRGREARKEILRLDEARRARARSRRSTPRVDTKTLQRQAHANIKQQLRDREKYEDKTVRKNVTHMTISELQYAIVAPENELADRARELPYVDLGNIEINPFWYH